MNLLPVRKNWVLFWFKISCSLFLLTLLMLLGLTGVNGCLERASGSPVSGSGFREEENLIDNWPNEMAQLQSELTQLNATIARLKKDSLEQHVTLLRLLAQRLPEKIWLTKIATKDKGELFIQGESMEYEQILRWMDRLKKIDPIQRVNLLSLEGNETFYFSISLEWGGDGE